ncbi:MAG TPA: flavodoxin-dependent (E)-4-hydroxy-3-methylbut-2-enyl-diphosphate synthase, partial [Clostridiaceae bacterium]|nr:flavodoxin-dependent (E)-4-hydroxy-3-methylbut-2-enyl-diphosphate synthase [Clostridiaceae bacterium]
MSQYLSPRRPSLGVRVGEVILGDGAPIAVQSMNNTDTRDVEATLAQIHELAEAGCDITRVAVLNQAAAEALNDICRHSPLPVVADIHFDYRLALAAIKNG